MPGSLRSIPRSVGQHLDLAGGVLLFLKGPVKLYWWHAACAGADLSIDLAVRYWMNANFRTSRCEEPCSRLRCL
jgi:hypothetical protein